MTLVASLTGTHNRKELANLIADVVFDTTAKYSGTGSINGYRFAYQVGPLTLTKENALVGFGTLPKDKQDQIAGILESNGYEFATISKVNEEPAQTATVAPTCEETEPAGTTIPGETTAAYTSLGDWVSIFVPNDLTDAQYQNLRNLIEQKENLLDLAFPGTLKLIRRTTDGYIEFQTWFELPAGTDTKPYSMLVNRMVDMAKAAKSVSTKQNPVINPKYQFRCFLLRLGFIGKEYGPARKALMQNLTGNSAWLRGGKDA